MSYNQIDRLYIECSIPSIEYLNCRHNFIKELLYWNLTDKCVAKLEYIKYIDCSYNKLRYLPHLGNNLTFLKCSHNQISSLPFIPKNIKNIYCKGNRLNKFPLLEMPSSIEFIDISETNIDKLPSILLKTPIFATAKNMCCRWRMRIYDTPVGDFIYHGKNREKYRINELINREWEQKYGGTCNTEKPCHIELYLIHPYVKKIENWFLNCKYNPKYKYCRNRLLEEHDKLFS